jgi:hypothetical protein
LAPARLISVLNKAYAENPNMLDAHRYLIDMGQHKLIIAILVVEMLAGKDTQQTGTHTEDDDKDYFCIGTHLKNLSLACEAPRLKRRGSRGANRSNFIRQTPRHISGSRA